MEKVHKIYDGLHEIGYTTEGSYGYMIHANGKCWGEYQNLELFNNSFALDWRFVSINKIKEEAKKRLYVNDELEDWEQEWLC